MLCFRCLFWGGGLRFFMFKYLEGSRNFPGAPEQDFERRSEDTRLGNSLPLCCSASKVDSMIWTARLFIIACFCFTYFFRTNNVWHNSSLHYVAPSLESLFPIYFPPLGETFGRRLWSTSVHRRGLRLRQVQAQAGFPLFHGWKVARSEQESYSTQQVLQHPFASVFLTWRWQPWLFSMMDQSGRSKPLKNDQSTKINEYHNICPLQSPVSSPEKTSLQGGHWASGLHGRGVLRQTLLHGLPESLQSLGHEA